jgi:hypothetical protein
MTEEGKSFQPLCADHGQRVLREVVKRIGTLVRWLPGLSTASQVWRDNAVFICWEILQHVSPVLGIRVETMLPEHHLWARPEHVIRNLRPVCAGCEFSFAEHRLNTNTMLCLHHKPPTLLK